MRLDSKPFQEMQTERLILRLINPEVYTLLFEDNKTEEYQMNTLGLTSINQLEKEKQKYKEGMWTYNKKFLYFLILSKDTNDVLGWCGYHTWYTQHNRAEIGYEIHDIKYRKQGYMKEAMDFIIPFGFNTLKLNRVEALIAHENIASKKLLERYTFQKEGILKGHYFTNNRFEDSIIYALLKKDYGI